MSIATLYKILYLQLNVVNQVNKVNDCCDGNIIQTIGGGRQVCGHNELHRRRPSDGGSPANFLTCLGATRCPVSQSWLQNELKPPQH